jgi:hypothetical protein
MRYRRFYGTVAKATSHKYLPLMQRDIRYEEDDASSATDPLTSFANRNCQSTATLPASRPHVGGATGSDVTAY